MPVNHNALWFTGILDVLDYLSSLSLGGGGTFVPPNREETINELWEVWAVVVTAAGTYVVVPVTKLCKMFAVICWIAGLTSNGNSKLSSPQDHCIVPALNTRAPPGAV